MPYRDVELLDVGAAGCPLGGELSAAGDKRGLWLSQPRALSAKTLLWHDLVLTGYEKHKYC